MEEPFVNVLVSEEELWLIRASVRHEMPQQEQWKFPPADRELNLEIALLIAGVEPGGEAHLPMTEGVARILDYTVPQDAKDKDGKQTGKNLLRKVCKARAELAYRTGLSLSEATEEPEAPTKQEVLQRLQEKS